MSEADTVTDASQNRLIGKGVVRETISKMNNENIANLSRLVSKMVKSAGLTGVDTLKDLISQMLVEEDTPQEQELGTIQNYYMGKGAALETRSYMGLKPTDQIMIIIERFVKRLIRKQVD